MDQQPHELPFEGLMDRNVGIKLVGVGGGGSNAVDRLKMENLDRLQLAVINTDFKALSTSPVQDKILIGTTLTRGLSAGGDPELGRKAAEADADKIAEIVKAPIWCFWSQGWVAARVPAPRRWWPRSRRKPVPWSSPLSRCLSASKADAA